MILVHCVKHDRSQIYKWSEGFKNNKKNFAKIYVHIASSIF